MQPYIGYVIIITICAIVTYLTLSKNPKQERWYPLALYSIAVAMVLMTSLSVKNTVLADTHLEYYYARLHSGLLAWEPKFSIPQETVIGSTIVAPFLTNAFGIPLIKIFTILYPVLFAILPVILYHIFKRWVTDRQAFLSAILFTAFPTFFMELPTISRQMLAELVLAGSLYLLIVSKLKYKVPLIILGGVLIPLFHYSTAFVSLVAITTSLVVALLLKQRAHAKVLSILLATLILTSGVYYSFTSGGSLPYKAVLLYNQFAPTAVEIPVERWQLIDTPKPLPEVSETPKSIKDTPKNVPLRKYYESLMQAGLGFDFLEVDGLSKLFRILQWAMFISMAVGLWILRRHKEYIVFTSGFILITALCILPGWAGILNSTRFVHFSLFLLAPACVVGFRTVLKRGNLILLFLLPYFLFTSGFVFEVTKRPNVESITIPYSIGMSNYRIDLGATFTKDDVAVRDYIISNNLFPLTADVFGSYFMQDIVGSRDDLNAAFEKVPHPIAKGYVYLRSRNVQDNSVTIWNGIGCRKAMDVRRYGVDPNQNIIFQSGDARLIKIGE